MELQTTHPPMDDFPFAGECDAAVAALREWKDRLMNMAVDNPLETLLVGVMGSAWVFFLAERGENEGVNTYDDALYYISTCLSVGYANIFPKTQIGKFVAAIVMTLGPSLSTWVVEGHLVARTAAEPAGAAGRDLTPVIDKLDAILQVLKAQQTGAA
ncbi:MAG: ion channel [Actinomycetota bacterium]